MKLDQWANLLKLSWPKSGYRIVWGPWREKRSLSQNAFQHVIYEDISAYLMSKGRTDCTAEWVKEMLKNKFLGWTEKEFVDVVTGERKMREVLRSTAGLDVGASYHYTTEIIDWAQSIGCEIKIPARCEYREMADRENQ